MAFGRIRTVRFLLLALALVIMSAVAGTALERTASASLLDGVAKLASRVSLPISRSSTAKRRDTQGSTVDNAYGSSGDRIIVGQGDGSVYTSGSRVDKIQVIQPTGTPVALSTIDDLEPQWSNDGKKIVFISLRDAPPGADYYTRHDYRSIYVMNADGSDQRRIFTGAFLGPMNPTFSPDGTKIAFLDNGDNLKTVEVYGSGIETDVDISECTSTGMRNTVRRRPGQDLIPGIYGPHSPDYSPDGNHLIYVQWDSDLGVYAIFRVPTDGSGGCTMVYASNDDVTPISPQYSPDGTKIAVYYVEGSGNPATAVRKLRIIDAATGATIADHTPSGFFGEPVWSPDGTKIAYPIGAYDEIPDYEIRGLGVRSYELATGIEEQIDLSGIFEGVNGLHWGVPTTVQEPLSMRINSPHPLASGAATTGTLYLDAPAPAGGTTVTLSALGMVGAITVPASVVIPEGQQTVDFPITSAAQTSYITAGVLATRSLPTIAQAQHSISLHPARPDIAATGFTVPSAAVPGVAFSTSRTIQNIGPVSSSSFFDGIYLSADNVLDAGDGAALVTQSQAILAAGASRGPTTLNVNIPASRIPASGQYYLIFKTNHLQAMVEGNYANNTIAQPIQVNTADLVVEDLVVPANVEPGTAYSLTFNVHNAGTVATSGTFATQIFFSEDNVAGNADDAQLLSFNITTSIAAGGVSPQSRSVSIPPLPARNSGPAFYYVKVDSGNVIPEGTTTGETNNNTFQATQFQYRLPDLVIENLAVPALVETGTQYGLTFNIRNSGEVATTVTFATQIFFSEDNVAGNADDAQLLSFNISTSIAAGGTSLQSRNVTIPTLPVRNDGPAFFYVKVDSGNAVTEGVTVGENNNITFQGTQFEYRVPDMQVTASSAPADVDTDTAFSLSWTTANTGNKATTANLIDRVYLSTDQTVGGDTTLGSFTLTGGLAAGATADRIQNITIAYANIPASGNYYLLIQTDQSNIVNEGANEGNNVRVQPIYVRKALRPDLVVTNVTAPPTVFFDQTIQVQWTVTNNGTGPTNAPQWKDRLYIGTSSTSTSGATQLADVNSITALNPGESYTTSAVVKIPRGFNGAYHFLVRTNSNNAVNEVSTTNNLLSSAVQVNVPPLPDLIVQSVQAPDEVFAGQPISINYSIQNIGTDAAIARKDRIYLSRDTTLNTSQDRLIFTSDELYGPTPGDATTHTSQNRVGTQNPPVYQLAHLPSDLEGLWYVFVVTDYQNTVYEFTGENNNTGRDIAEPGAPMNILVTPPDLVIPDQPTAPATVASGEAFPVEFTVRNQGAFVASAFLYHAVYLSTDATFNATTDTLIGTYYDQDPFGPGAEHPVTLNVATPYCLPNGTYYLFAVADHNGRQFEFDPGFDAEANNASPAKQITLSTVPPDLQVTFLQHTPVTSPGQTVTVNWTVANTGGNASGNWIDRVRLISADPQIAAVTLASVQHTGGLAGGASYSGSRTVTLPAYMQGDYYLTLTTDADTTVNECGTSETNNAAQGSTFTVQNNLPDIVIDSVSAPTSATVGDSFLVQWTGRNAGGSMPSGSSTWRDNVYLSTDTTLSGGDTYLGNALNSSLLNGGQSYPQQTMVTIGNVAPGTYYLLAYGDGSKNIYEGTSDSGFESNNVQASAAITLSAPAVDLSAGSVSVSTPHYSGTYRTVTWTVTNVGTSPTLASSWTDYVYLSRDSILDPSDTQLTYRTHAGVLAGGASYVQSTSVFIPVGLTGDYTVFVVTDKNNSVVENNNSNNTSLPLGINLTVPPPAELSITNISPAATVALGGNAVFTWTVQNSGANPVEGQWRDTVYLSKDQFWDASDTLVGIRDLNSSTTSVPAAGGTYTASHSGQLPPVDEGTYYAIVRTDAQNRIRESNEANNVSTSVSTTMVTITELQLNTPFNTTLGNGASLFFKYVTEPAETLVFSLDTDTPSRSNEALTNFDTVVSRADYDFQSSRPGEGNQENVISETQEGKYFSMVRTDLIPESFAGNFDKELKKTAAQNGVPVPDQNIIVQAKILPFSIRSVSPEEAGNAGYASLIVEGAKFQAGATLKLVGSGGTEITPLRTTVFTSSVAAIFDLKGKPAGDYDIVVRNPDNQTATLPNGFKVISGGGASEPRVSIKGPNASRGGRVRYSISVSNDGLNDQYLVPIMIAMPSRFAYQLDMSNHVGDMREYMQPDAIPSQLPAHYEADGIRIIPLFTPVLGSRRTVTVNIDVVLPFGFSGFSIKAAAFPPMTDWYEMSRSDQTNLLNRKAALLGNGTEEQCNENLKNCMRTFVVGLLFAALQEFLPSGCIGAVFGGVVTAVDTVMGVWLNGGPGDAWNKLGTVSNLIASTLGGVGTECAGQVIPWLKIVSIALTCFKGFMDWLNCVTAYYDCLPPPPEEHFTSFPISIDPNEKIGPEGYGGEKFVPVGQPLEYRINFENLSSATAPAQLVRITDQLPPSLDLRTVRLKEIGFKQNRYVIPDGQSYYQSRVQLGEDLGNLQADILAGVDLVNNRVFWTIQAIDPNTGEAPLDPFGGILPPNNANKDGEGFVIFTVEARSSFPNRTMISNSATIIFDQNEPIVTNATSNLLDSVIPTSQIAPLPATSAVPEIPINWTTSDDNDGSGFASTILYSSENGGTYTPFLNSGATTSTTFGGKWGRTYRFYSIGRDNAGNVEAAPSQPDATIRILGGDTEGDVAPRPNGNDGQVGNDDVAQVRRFIANLDSANVYNEFQRSDAAPRLSGGDGALSVGDVIQARRYAAALDNRSEAAGPETPFSYSPKPIAGMRSGLLPREIKPVSLYRAGNKVIVAVDLEAQGDEVAAGFAMNFDPAVLSSPSSIELGPDAAGAVLTINDSQAAAGKLGIAIDRAPTSPFAAGSRRLLYIAFDVAPGHPPTTNISFTSDPVISEVVDGTASTLATAFTAANVSLLVPTSAGATIEGTVIRANGAGLSRATVVLSGAAGARRSVLTNGFGRFRFDDVAVGETYTIDVRAKGLVFRPRLITVTEDVSGIEIGPEP